MGRACEGLRNESVEPIGQVRAPVKVRSGERSRGSKPPLRPGFYPEGVTRGFSGGKEQIALSLTR